MAVRLMAWRVTASDSPPVVVIADDLVQCVIAWRLWAKEHHGLLAEEMDEYHPDGLERLCGAGDVVFPAVPASEEALRDGSQAQIRR